VQLDDSETALQRTERLKQQFADVESLFNSQEADLMVVNNDLVLRLTGLSFAPGRAVIDSSNYGLLSRVQRAIYIFNDANVIVEAHTDSQGEEDANLVLSQQRANAIRTYLLANSDIPLTRISSEGFGESRPIASNMYEDGRAKNRRIDIVFKNVRPGGPASARSAR
jgi:outer membrane protein OmpA-like peptidoglycan-associated protein